MEDSEVFFSIYKSVRTPAEYFNNIIYRLSCQSLPHKIPKNFSNLSQFLQLEELRGHINGKFLDFFPSIVNYSTLDTKVYMDIKILRKKWIYYLGRTMDKMGLPYMQLPTKWTPINRLCSACWMVNVPLTRILTKFWTCKIIKSTKNNSLTESMDSFLNK